MLNSLFILRENGTCVYERHWIETNIDGQIFSGFITALSAIAIESMGEKLQSLKTVRDQRLAILKHKRSPIIGVIIADVRDNGLLLNKILQKILDRFYWLFQKEIEIDDASLMGKTKKFSKEIDIILKRKIAERSYISIIIGFLAATGLAFGIALLILLFGINFASGGGFQNTFIAPVFINLFDGAQPWEFLQIQQIAVIIMAIISLFFIMLFFGPGILGAYIAGSRKLGVINGILLIFGAYAVFASIQYVSLSLYSINLLQLFVGFSPILFILNILTGYFGGLLRERAKLWPIRGEEISEKVKHQVTDFVKKTFHLDNLRDSS